MKGKGWRALHMGGMGLWVVLTFPTLLWWRESIIVVLLYSIYANFIGHFSAYQGARVEAKEDKKQEAEEPS